jgi:hypothetical protein
VRTLKGLEDVIQLVTLDWELFPEGWYVLELVFLGCFHHFLLYASPFCDTAHSFASVNAFFANGFYSYILLNLWQVIHWP